MKRRRLSPSARAALLKKQDGHCCVPGCTETRNLEEEHSTPHTWTGALPDQLMCKPHHKEKTFGGRGRVGGDVRDIAHAARIAEGRTQYDKRKERGSLIRSIGKLVSRGFRKDVSKKFNGEVVRRDR